MPDPFIHPQNALILLVSSMMQEQESEILSYMSLNHGSSYVLMAIPSSILILHKENSQTSCEVWELRQLAAYYGLKLDSSTFIE